MRRNFRFILLLVKLRLSHLAVFRLNFFMVFFADGTLFLTQLLAFDAIYSQVEGIGGWSRGQMIIFLGTFSIINALNMLIYFFGIVDLPGKIKRGDLDQYLTKPVSPLLRLTFESVDPGSIPLVVMSIGIVAYGVSIAGTPVSFGLAVGYTALVLLMTVLWYDMELILRTIPFLIISGGGIQRIEEPLIDLNFKVPGVLFKGGLKIIFYFLLPYGIMSTVPAQLITGSLSVIELVTAVGTVGLFTAFAMWFWRFGLRHYKSASS